jgi:HTH-type transcriptional regulator/antitoxin HipB
LSPFADFATLSSNADIWEKKAMRIRTPIDIGAVIRDRRTKLGLDQKSLAAKVGVSRQWIVEVEKGKPRAEIGLVLRTVEALGLNLASEDPGNAKSQKGPPPIDIDSIVAGAREKRK